MVSHRNPVSRGAGLCRFRRAWRWLAPIAILLSGCNSVFYYPDREERGTPSDLRLAYEDVYFVSKDGVRLHGWFMPAQGQVGRASVNTAADRELRPTVLHVHGNAANITGHYEFVAWLPPRGFNVLAFDYRGYGRSAGRPTREGTIADAFAALDYLHSRADVDASRLLLFGQSIGASIATIVAAERPSVFRGVVLDSAFTNYREIVHHHVHSRALLTVLAWWYPLVIPHGHDPLDVIGRIAPTPVLILHGTHDRIVPLAMARRLFEAAREPKELALLEGMDHLEAWMIEDHDAAAARMAAFFDKVLRSD